jgi:hypothetical protein
MLMIMMMPSQECCLDRKGEAWSSGGLAWLSSVFDCEEEIGEW